MNVGILFGLVRLLVCLQPCSGMLVLYSTHVSMAMFYVCWYFIWSLYGHVLCICCILGGISTLVQMVPPCSIYVGILFSLSMWVFLVQLCSTYVGILFGLSMLVQVVWPCSMVYVGILFHPSHVSTFCTAMSYAFWYFILPQSR